MDDKKPKVSGGGSLKRSNGTFWRAGFDNTFRYMRSDFWKEKMKKEMEETKKELEKVYDYDRVCCQSGTCLIGCKNKENNGDHQTCLKKVKKVKSMLESNPSWTLESIGIPVKYHSYYREMINQLHKEEENANNNPTS